MNIDVRFDEFDDNGNRLYLKHQWEFLKDNYTPLIGLVAGFGAGKTFSFLRKTFLHLLTSINPRTKKSNGLIVYPTYKLAEEVFVDPFSELLLNSGIDFVYNKQNHSFKVPQFGNVLLYQLQKPDLIVGFEYTYAGFDEFDVGKYRSCEIAYKKTIGRLRGKKNAQLYIVTTPEGYKYTYQLFRGDIAKNPRLKDSRKLIQANSLENPYLDDSYFETLYNNYDSRLLKAYLRGEFVNLESAAAYYNFDRKRNVKKFEDLPYKDSLFNKAIAMDFNVDPMSALLIRHNNTYEHVEKEIILPRSNTEEMARHLRTHHPDYISLYSDPAGASSTTKASTTDYSILQKYGFQIYHKSHARQRDRLNIVNRQLYNSQGNALLTIEPDCGILIDDLEKVVTNKLGGIDKSDPRLTHASDALGYFEVYERPIVQFRYAGE